MSYSALDAYGSVITVDSSIVSGVIQRPIVNIASILTPLNISISGNPSISGTVNVGNMPSVNAFITNVPSVNATIAPASVYVLNPVSTIGASIIGLTPVSVSNFPTTQNISGSVVAFGTIGASIIGLAPVAVSNFPTTQNVSGSVVAFISGTPTVVVNNGSVIAFQGGTRIASVSGVGGISATSSVYQVLSSVTSVSILSANNARIGATIYNNAGTTVYAKLGAAATTSIFTVALNANDYYELPFGWTGVVAGIAASNAGIITVTELT